MQCSNKRTKFKSTLNTCYYIVYIGLSWDIKFNQENTFKSIKHENSVDCLTKFELAQQSERNKMGKSIRTPNRQNDARP